MLNTSEAYKKAIIASRRKIIPKSIINLIDPDIVYGTVDSSGLVRYVDPGQLYDKKMTSEAIYHTLEHNYTILNGTAKVAPDAPDGTETGAVVDVMSGEDCRFNAPYPFVQVNVSNLSVLQAASIYFSDYFSDGIAVDFIFEVYSGGVVAYSKEITGNQSLSVYFDSFTAYDVTSLRVTAKAWSLPYRRLRVLEIVPGIYEQMSGRDIFMVDVLQQVSFDNMTITHGSATLSVNNKSKRWNPYNKNSVFKSIEARQSIPISFSLLLPDGTREDVPLGVFYQQEEGWDTSANGLTMTFKLVDIVGLLKDRSFGDPGTLPTTLGAWVAAIVGKLGENFANHFIIDPSLASLSLTATKAQVQNLTCGNLLRYLCMATGAFFRADQETGYLRIDPFADKQGSLLDLGNMPELPKTSANMDAADITFKIGSTDYVLSGNQTSSGKSLRVENPFIKTEAQAMKAAQNILVHYGGNKYQIVGRGDMSCEPGDIDTIETGFGNTVSGRRYRQQLRIQRGVMSRVTSEFLQATGSQMYENRIAFTADGAWTAPVGVTEARIVLVGQGEPGAKGTDGDYGENGIQGAGGLGGKILVQKIVFNPLQSFTINIAASATFGAYSSSAGRTYPGGWGDLFTGEVFGVPGRRGVLSKQAVQGEPGAPGTGNGGQGGSGGTMGVYGIDRGEVIIKKRPGKGGLGGLGGSGCAIVYYNGGGTP